MLIIGFLRMMVDKGASDLHLMVGSAPVVRVFGVLVSLDEWPILSPEDVQAFFDQMTTDDQRLQFERERELDFSYSVPGLSRFRVNVLQQRGTLSLAIRVVPQWLPSIDELEIP